MEVRNYLQRINMAADVRVDYKSLRLIQLRHMLSVPFENLDIIDHRVITLDLDAIYEKIVVKRRGGYCYELNGLLGWFLGSVGFTVSMISGRVYRGDGTYGPEFDHLALLVKLDEHYIVDVGLGDSARGPLPLSGKTVTDVSGSYRINRGTDSQVFVLEKLEESQWVAKCRFTLLPRKLEEFSKMNYYQQKSPESAFSKDLICSLATEEGRVTIAGRSLIQTVGTRTTKREIASVEERDNLLRSLFGINWSK